MINYHVKNVIKTIILQKIKPKEVILVDSGDKNNYETYVEFLIQKILIVYI